MREYIKRFLIAGIMAVCVSLLFFGIKHAEAASSINEVTANWMWPSDGVITDSFGTRQGQHMGIDIASSPGTSIHAVENGVVSKSYYSDTYGNVVFIKHDKNFETVYAHLQARMVQKGTRVHKGDVIGKMGSTGDSSGVHLHFEVHQSHWTVDKKNALNPMLALGEVKVGQAVAAVQKDQLAVETAGRLMDDVKAEYVVQAGDTLYSIAKKMNISVWELKEKNHLKNDLIIPEQKLILK
ncbi:peptidoglycan DD-metalloendopeptidase family protein [Niallia endozanthoxylica]|uniref:Peptidoglycan DD-metalloendopeptidase family protein n=2 Tax=Niallia endozanthoxylica TaxID=2036016 RepID=A0A5J5HUX0_9BACI|nr:peptidoglycan DD-metalloendopeptidase family protein [Niallia endozanthoxylica]KAA9026165.1 peptidoglycan DD-metalloendopeptidase family protein [Niallia endozanthoxylica]